MRGYQLIFFLCFLIFTGCEFMKESRISTQISSDFSVELSEGSNLILYEDFGWAEEGGYNSLLQLSRKDCAQLIGKIDSTINVNPNSTYFEFFTKQGVKLENAQYAWIENGYLNYRKYVLEPSSCILFIQYHFE